MADESIVLNSAGAYVYAIVVDGVVRYIGKGKGNRVFHHVRRARVIAKKRAAGERIRSTRFYSRLVKAIARSAVIEERIILSDLSDEDAFTYEREAIVKTGLVQLWNTNEGGVGPTSEDVRRLFQNPEHRAKHKAAMNTPVAIERRRAATVAQWADPVVRARKMEALQKSWQGQEARRENTSAQTRARFSSEVARSEHSKRMRIVGADPELRAKRSATAQRLAADPNYCAKLSATIKLGWKKPGALERKADASKRSWADPESRARRSAAIKAARSTPESREKTRAQMKAFRAKQRAER